MLVANGERGISLHHMFEAHIAEQVRRHCGWGLGHFARCEEETEVPE
jgi:hypothetical protein